MKLPNSIAADLPNCRGIILAGAPTRKRRVASRDLAAAHGRGGDDRGGEYR
jgi:hypothetical protein